VWEKQIQIVIIYCKELKKLIRRQQQLRKASAPAMLNENAGISFTNYTKSATHNCRHVKASSMTVAPILIVFNYGVQI